MCIAHLGANGRGKPSPYVTNRGAHPTRHSTRFPHLRGPAGGDDARPDRDFRSL